jgi:DNA polymerase
MVNSDRQALMAALEWQLEVGADEALADEAIDATKIPLLSGSILSSAPQPDRKKDNSSMPRPMGAVDARSEAVNIAAAVNSLEELRDAIESFDGLPPKKTAKNMVFGDGNVNAPVMLIGDAPGPDGERLGKPFAGEVGELLDLILKSIGIDRNEEDATKSIYMSNVLNWRPPGNRTPTSEEIDISMPFIEKHIALVEPKILVLLGGLTAQSLLRRTEGISKLRNKWHDYSCQTKGIEGSAKAVSAVVTYHPLYLLKTPGQKRAVWNDMLLLNKKRQDLGLV